MFAEISFESSYGIDKWAIKVIDLLNNISAAFVLAINQLMRIFYNLLFISFYHIWIHLKN